jgi:hypothetical protein
VAQTTAVAATGWCARATAASPARPPAWWTPRAPGGASSARGTEFRRLQIALRKGEPVTVAQTTAVVTSRDAAIGSPSAEAAPSTWVRWAVAIWICDWLVRTSDSSVSCSSDPASPGLPAPPPHRRAGDRLRVAELHRAHPRAHGHRPRPRGCAGPWRSGSATGWCARATAASPARPPAWWTAPPPHRRAGDRLRVAELHRAHPRAHGHRPQRRQRRRADLAAGAHGGGPVHVGALGRGDLDLRLVGAHERQQSSSRRTSPGASTCARASTPASSTTASRSTAS